MTDDLEHISNQVGVVKGGLDQTIESSDPSTPKHSAEQNL